jgi:hypothetical protein
MERKLEGGDVTLPINASVSVLLARPVPALSVAPALAAGKRLGDRSLVGGATFKAVTESGPVSPRPDLRRQGRRQAAAGAMGRGR